MTDSEWIANIHNFSNAEIFEQLEQIGCDGYYRDIWSACIEELQRRVNLTSGDLISREALKEAIEVTQYNDIDDLTRTERLIDSAPAVCGNNPKWCESCVSKGKCASTSLKGGAE